MFIHYRTQGIVLKKEDWGEANQIFTIFTRDFGRLEILGKGIRKISSKLRSGIDIFYLSEIEFIQGKTYKTLIDAISIEKFENIRKDLKRLALAYRIAEVLDNLVKEQEPDEKIWNLLNESFNKLNNFQLSTSHLYLIYYYFLWNLLSILGYSLELYSCPLCQKKLIPGALYFSLEEGGVVCPSCFKKAKLTKKIDSETIKIIRLFLEKAWPILSKLKIKENHLKLLKEISSNYLNFILEKSK